MDTNDIIRCAKRSLIVDYREQGIKLSSGHVVTEYDEGYFMGFRVMCSVHDCIHDAEWVGLFQVENPSEGKPDGVQVKRVLCKQHSYTSSAWGVWPFDAKAAEMISLSTQETLSDYATAYDMV